MVAQADTQADTPLLDNGDGSPAAVPSGIVIAGPDGVPTLVTSAIPTPEVSLITPPSTATPTGPASTRIVQTVTASASQAAATSSTADSGSGIPLNIVIPAVVAPVVVLLIAIPLGIWLCFRHRNKKLMREQRRMSTPDMLSSSDGRLLNKESQSFKPFTDGEKPSNSDTHSSLDNDGMGEAIALNARNRSWSNESRNQRGNPQHFPSTSVTKRPERPERPKPRPTTGEAWPLPAHSSLPEPKDKPLPVANSSQHLPPVQLHEPLTLHDSLATDSSLYDLSSTAKNFPDPPTSGAAAGSGYKKRDSDLVSELSNPEETNVRPNMTRRDTDNVSIISAMTSHSHSRRKSSASAVSALGPDDHPAIPTEPLPRR